MRLIITFLLCNLNYNPKLSHEKQSNKMHNNTEKKEKDIISMKDDFHKFIYLDFPGK